MTAIVCVSRSWGIGRDGALLFRISADHKRFRTLTVGKTVILGHKTLDTFPGGKPLKDRRNIVLSHRDLDVPGAEIAHSFDAAAALGGDDAIVIGGASVYMALLSRCDRVYVTKVDADPDADQLLPPTSTTIPTGASSRRARPLRKTASSSASRLCPQVKRGALAPLFLRPKGHAEAAPAALHGKRGLFSFTKENSPL